jgi:hypothetical protein
MTDSARLDYPDSHIEADNRLAYFLGSMARRFNAERTVWVHLRREIPDVVNSYLPRRTSSAQILNAFGHGILMSSCEKSEMEWREICELMIRTTRDNIEQFISTQRFVVRMDLEDPLPGLRQVWLNARAEGDFTAATEEWSIRHNKSKIKLGKDR